jgi:hypothetical protein
MEKKIEVEVNGRVMRVPEHMLSDMMKFGATQTKRSVKEPPKELLNQVKPQAIITPKRPPELEKKVTKPENQFPEPQEIVTPDPLTEKPKNKGGRPKK